MQKGRHQGEGSAHPEHPYPYAHVRIVCVLVVSEINIFKSFAHPVSWRNLVFTAWNPDVFSSLSLGYCAFGYSQARWRFCHNQPPSRAIGWAVGCSFVFPVVLARQGAVDRAGQLGRWSCWVTVSSVELLPRLQRASMEKSALFSA